MKIRLSAVIAAVAALVVALVLTSAPASAATQDVKWGAWGKLYDGMVVQSWKVDSLKKSSDTIPNYPLAGQLWEAKATVRAEQGTVTPVIPNLNARSSDGTNYRVLWQAYSPQSIPGATIVQGTENSGKVYFDVTGPSPNSVAYFNGADDLIVWM
jgi:hypothetical protein